MSSSFSVYDVAVPTFTRALKAFNHILTTAEEFANEKGVDVNTEYFPARLIEDQKPLVFQVQNATRIIKKNVNHLTGNVAAPFEDTEKTFSDLHRRIQATLELLNTVTPDVANAFDNKTLQFGHVHLTVKQGLLQHAIPNVIFHLTTGYSILRAKGVPLGKDDFITEFLIN